MFNELKEKSSTLSKVGSFYSSIITDKDRYTAHKVSHITYTTNLFKLFNSLKNLLQGDAYFNNKFLLVKFQDKDIKYGTYSSTSAQQIPSLEQISIYPDTLQGDTSKITIGLNLRLAFVLTIPKNLYIRVILLPDGSVLSEGLNFKSQFGKIIFTDNPISLFNSMEFLAASYTERKRNILCYPLLLQDIYGDVSNVISYYRNNQSLSLFKKALYQAIGVPIVLKNDVIIDRVNLSKGVSYITSLGLLYDADFNHIYLNIGDTLQKDQIIGGEEFLKVYLPNDNVPSSISSISILNMSISGGKSLYILNVDAVLYVNNMFLPQNLVYGDGAQYYTDYVNSVGLLEKPVNSIPDRMNCIYFLRNVVANNRCIILDVDKEKIPYDLSMKLKSFIIDHAPIGAVIAEVTQATTPPIPPPPIIIESSTTVVSFGNEVNPDPELITDSFYYNNVYGGDIDGTLTNGASVSITSTSKVWSGPKDGSIEGVWENHAAINEINTALKLKHGFTSQDFATGSDIYYTSTGTGGSTSELKLDLKDTVEVGDNIILVVSITSRAGAAGGFWVRGVDNALMLYAGNDGNGFTLAEGTSLTYNDSMDGNWSNDTEGAQLFMVTGNVSALKLITLGQPNINKNGWLILAYRTYRLIN